QDHLHSDRGERLAAGFKESSQMLDCFKLGLLPVTLSIQVSRLAERKARAWHGRVQGFVLTRKKAAGQGIVRNYAKSLIAAQRQQLALDFAIEKVIARLDTVE